MNFVCKFIKYIKIIDEDKSTRSVFLVSVRLYDFIPCFNYCCINLRVLFNL